MKKSITIASVLVLAVSSQATGRTLGELGAPGGERILKGGTDVSEGATVGSSGLSGEARIIRSGIDAGAATGSAEEEAARQNAESAERQRKIDELKRQIEELERQQPENQ
jgi:hypothetical protein